MRILAIFLIVICFECFGQKQANIWYFGDYAGIDFNSGSPIALLNGQLTYPNGQSHNEGASAISDSSGSILFYSDGMTVWNRDHQIMQNGTGLLGNFSSTQSSIIVPDPAYPNRYYYLFSISSGFCCGGNISDGLRYSKVDMCLDDSRGGVIPTEKNIKLVDTVAEKIAVTRHANGTDYWILTHRFYSNEFWVLHLGANGIIDTVISTIGSTHSGNIAGSQGQLKVSPNGQKIAIGGSNGLNLLELFDFDKTTGVISNQMSLTKPNSNNANIYGIEFSPDNSKLYAQGISSLVSLFTFLVQYDLSSGNLSTINASLNFLYNNTIGVMSGKGLQLGPDGKIYMVSLALNATTLSVINNPNIYGLGCNYQDQSISLGGKIGSYSLPSFISGFDYSNGLISCEQSGISENLINKMLSSYPNPFSSSTTLQTDYFLKNATLTVVNCFGRIVKQTKNISRQTLELSRDNLASGIYFVWLTEGHKIIASDKLVITD